MENQMDGDEITAPPDVGVTGASSSITNTDAPTIVLGEPSTLNTAEDDQTSEPDSAYDGSFNESETLSLSQDITEYVEENGRTYHSFGSTEYWGSNDEKAQAQQEISHSFFKVVLDYDYFIAPIKDPQRILDVGTGTGAWVMDVADEFPAAIVKGIDVSPIQPWWTPPNARFEIDDFNIPWDVENRYDLIHSRELLGSVPNWPNFFSQAFKALEPGGWMDCAEPSVHFTSDFTVFEETDAHLVWLGHFQHVGKVSGMTYEVAENLKAWMQEAGFVDIREKVVQVPVGQWSEDGDLKLMGLYNQIRMLRGIRDFTERRLRNFLGWWENEITSLVDEMQAWVRNSGNRAVQPIYFVCGQKPMT